MALRFQFVPVLGGRLALSERPKISEVGVLRDAACDIVVTILPARGEQAQAIGAEVESHGMAWEWLKNCTDDQTHERSTK